MAIKLGWFAVRSSGDLAPVLTKVRARASAQDVPKGFRIARAGEFTSAVLIGGEFHAAPMWAQAVSQELGCAAVSFFVFEGTWNYAIFDAGEEVAAMEVWSLPMPTLYGDVERAAALLGVEPDLFRRYEAALRSAVVEDEDADEDADEDDDDEDDDDDDSGEPDPFPGDEYAPHDEWAHTDFARRLGGITYPDPDDGTELLWDGDLPENATWIGLPPRLPTPGG